MTKYIFSTLTLCVCLFLLPSCGKHFYIIKGKEINRYAKKAKETTPAVFIEYQNGDTLKGIVLKKKHNIINGKKTWLLDGKIVPLENIRSYQDKYGYRYGDYSRIIKGKMSLFLYQVDNSYLQTSYSSSTNSYNSQLRGGTSTSFYMGTEGYPQEVTFNLLTAAMQDCSAASKQVITEFGKTVWKRKPDLAINDYRALIRILKIYNSCN